MIDSMDKTKIIVTGSIAIDTLMYHNGALKDGLPAGEFMGAAFNVRTVESFWGGCAGNIVFNSALVHKKSADQFVMVGMVGSDFAEYQSWLHTNKIATNEVVTVDSALTAHAYILTDAHGKQFIMFYEGPGLHEHEARPKVIGNLTAQLPQAALCHIAPNSHWFMTECMTQSRSHGVPYFFDPGQALGLFTKEELFEAISHAHGLFANELEYERMQSVMGVELDTLLAGDTSLHFIVITKAEKGSEILVRDGEKISLPAATHAVVDPTGCGDAYRGAFLSVLANALTGSELNRAQKSLSEILKTRELIQFAGQSGSVLAGTCLGTKGTQRHAAA